MISRAILYAPDDEQLLASNDCDCACPSGYPAAAVASLHPASPVRRHPQLQQLALDGEQSVAFVPSVSRVVVLGRQAREFLDLLNQPVWMDALSAEQREAAEILLRLGLLVSDHDTAGPAEPDTLVAWLHVTNACNLRCTYCYIEKSDDAMSAETAYAAVDAIIRSALLHGYHALRLKYAGGEASLNLALVEQIHAYAAEQAERHHLMLTGVVLSNGVGLTRTKLSRMLALGLRLMISIDGPQPIHDAQRPRIGGQGSYAAALASVERARALGLDLTISVTITGASVAGLAELVDWLLEREIHFTLGFYRECDASAPLQALQLDERRLIEGMRAAYQVIERRLPRYSLLGSLLDRSHMGASHRRTCAVGENYLVINQHGGVAKCQMTIDQTITTIWEPDPLLAVRLDQSGVQNLPVEEKEGCRDCEWRHWCAGGCSIVTFRATGRYDVRSPNCRIYKALYPDVIRLEGLRILRWHTPAFP